MDPHAKKVRSILEAYEEGLTTKHQFLWDLGTYAQSALDGKEELPKDEPQMVQSPEDAAFWANARQNGFDPG